MKTRAFIERMEEIGCAVYHENDDIKIWYNGYNLGFVSSSDPYIMATYKVGFDNCGLDATDLNIVNRYMGRLSRTDIMDRNEPLFYLRVALPMVNDTNLYFGFKDDENGIYSFDFAVSFTQEELDNQDTTGFVPISEKDI